jgi:hypothetical protein
MEQCCGPLSVKMVLGDTAISAPSLPRVRELSLAHAQKCSFLIMEQSFVPLAIKCFPRKHCDFRTYLAERARAHSGVCAEVKFDYGTVLWSAVSRNVSRKALRFQQLSCQEREWSVWSMRRGAVSCVWKRDVVPWQ